MNSTRRILLITTAVFLILITVTLPVPSFSGTDNPALDLTQAFREALLDQESKNQQILLPLLAISLLLLGLLILWARAQKRAITEKPKGAGIGEHRATDNPGEKRRAWLRLPVNQYFLYARDETERYKKSRTINIGGGGLLFATDQEFNKKDKMIINIEMFPGKKINLVGEVVWTSENSADRDSKRFLVGIRFINIRRGDQDHIVRRILKKQREIITQEKRKNQNECILCGMLLPPGDRESICPRCRAEENA